MRPFGIYTLINDHFWLIETENQPHSRSDFQKDEFQVKPPKASADLIPSLLGILRDEWINRNEAADRTIGKIRGLSGTTPAR